MIKKAIITSILGILIGFSAVTGPVPHALAIEPDKSFYNAYPPFMANNTPPMVMLVMGRNHKLFYEAYNDASDLNEDGVLDITYKPDEIDYYGYFDSYKYYLYDGVNDRFEPVGDGIGTNNKMKPAGNFWSGDFLNYVTMSRMDAIRKVLYGGYRVVDTDTETVLERAFIPQDAHSWGKEYESVARDGYDISDYTPLSLPASSPVQTRHMFGSTSLYDPDHTDYRPLLRVMPNNPHRIWEWVAKERPVVDSSLEISGGSTWMVVPDSNTHGISNLTQTFYDLTPHPGHPADNAAYDTMVTNNAIPANQQGGVLFPGTIDGSGNPNDTDGDNDNYLTIFTGTLNIDTPDTYNFAVDGDDAVEFIIDINGNGDFTDDPAVASWYGGHGNCNCNTYDGSVALAAGSYQFQFRHEEAGGGDNYYLRWEVNTTASQIEDYRVRVVVADAAMPEDNARRYPNGNYKPIGLLQRYGEPETMYFGMISGSYALSMSGGVLRKNISSIRDEINLSDGTFTNLVGIIGTIDRFRIVDFRYPTSVPTGNYVYGGGWVTTRPMNEGEFPDWGNPLAEMLFEAMRYFGGEGGPTSSYHDSTMDLDDWLGLPNVAWQDPYANYPNCTKPMILSLSDIYPTYDSDEVPGSAFGSMSAAAVGNGGVMDVGSLGDLIFSNEQAAGNRFIGSNDVVDDGACTAKAVDGFGDIRGLCPEEPTKQGSYYSASVSHYGLVNDINAVDDDQSVRTYAVGLASPLPTIDIPIQGQNIRLVPFAKSVGGCLGVDGTQGNFQPTNTIVDFFVETISPHSGRFRINYEDVEQGADHDMDAIVIYEYQLVDANGNPVTAATIGSAVAVNITLTSEYAAGCIDQHMGYIISGSTADGTYLEVRDINGSLTDYFMDTPSAAWAAGSSGLPYTQTRTFTVDPAGGASAANLLPNPLWYAAKWGAFNDSNGNDIPDVQKEWDKDLDGVPDTYYYVVNPLKLEQQLNRSFAAMSENISSGTAAAVVANNSEGQGTMIQAFFEPKVILTDKEVTWRGHLRSMWVDQFGNLREDDENKGFFDFDRDNIIKFEPADPADPNSPLVLNRYTKHYHMHPDNQFDSECVISDCTYTREEDILLTDIDPVFDAGERLRDRTTTRKIFTFLDGDGADSDGDGTVDESGENEGAKAVGQVSDPMGDSITDNFGEMVDFNAGSAGRLAPFLGVKDDTVYNYLGTTGATVDDRHQNRVLNLIDYIRGKDSIDLIGTPNTRDRTGDDDKVWKLGDIVRSTPVNIAGAVESYDLIYGDLSYLKYRRAMAGRESVVYVGANDGMLHAFSHGDYEFNETTQKHGYKPVGSTPIGDELWAYIPQSLLPHLKWLADPDYGHVFYMDAKPKVFEARIFADDNNHPGGWGTILLVGMGSGGKRIWSEADFDASLATPDVVREFYSSYVCMDVTDPRNPRLLWERSYANLGMSAAYPAIMQVGTTYNPNSDAWTGGEWYAVVGSGPNDRAGLSDYNGYSDQNGRILILDLETGDLLRDFDTGLGNTVMANAVTLDKGEDDPNSPISGLSYNVDAIYAGSSTFDGTNFTGKLFKINTRSNGTVPDVNPANWSLSTLLESGGGITVPPITAAPTLSVDKMSNIWILFGTGRFKEMADRTTTQQNYLLGIKDPYFNSQYDASNGTDYNGRGDFYQNNGMALTLNIGDLFLANPYESFSMTGTIAPDVPNGGLSRITSWGALLEVVRNLEDQGSFPDYYNGWFRLLDARDAPAVEPSERVITKPVVLSSIMFTPVYIPDDDVCGLGGGTDMYGVYFETGTSFRQHVFDADVRDPGDTVLYRTGRVSETGPPPPMLSLSISGPQKGVTLYMQTAIGFSGETKVRVEPPGNYVKYWTEMENAPPSASPPSGP